MEFPSIKVVGRAGSRIVLWVNVPYHDFEEYTNGRGVAIKILRIDREFEALNYEYQRVDAIASKRLTPAPEANDVYSYCGMSAISELSSGLLLADLMKENWFRIH